MAGLLDIFGRGDGNLGLLGTSPEDIQKAQQQARAQSLFALADRLYQGGSTGQSIAQGLQQGQQAYNTAMQDKLKQRLQSDEMKQKLAERQRMLQAQQLMGQIQTPAVMPTDPLKDIYGQEQAGPNMPQAAGIDRNVVSRLMQTPEGREQLKGFSEAQKAARQLGLSGQGATDNPFKMFLSDPAMPPALRNLAAQLSSSYEKGLIEPEKVDERVRQLSQMQQTAYDRAASREQQEAMARLTASLRPERMVTIMGSEGQPVTVPQSQAGNQPLYSPAASKAMQETKSKADAKNQLSALVSDLGSDYDTLKKSGSIVSSGGTGVENIGARISSSGVGQFFGGTVGTEAQSTRQAIAQKRPLLLNLIKNATGMSAQQMNSNAEMQLYLQAATDPTLSYEANMSALENLDKMFGLGQFKAEIDSDDNPFGK